MHLDQRNFTFLQFQNELQMSPFTFCLCANIIKLTSILKCEVGEILCHRTNYHFFLPLYPTTATYLHLWRSHQSIVTYPLYAYVVNLITVNTKYRGYFTMSTPILLYLFIFQINAASFLRNALRKLSPWWADLQVIHGEL